MLTSLRDWGNTTINKRTKISQYNIHFSGEDRKCKKQVNCII